MQQAFKFSLIVLIVPFLMVSCSTIKVISLMKKGDVSEIHYHEIIPFDFNLGFVFIPIVIDGETYNFLLDSGAPNVLSKELAEKLNLKEVTSYKVEDSQTVKTEMKFVQIDSLSIGSLDFYNTGAAVSDFFSSVNIGCLEIDGILGANIMRKSIWKLDFQNKTIDIVSSSDSLNLSDGYESIPFIISSTGTPICDIEIDEVESFIIADLGSNGGINITNKTLKKIKKKSPPIQLLKGYGSSAEGISGYGSLDSTYDFIASKIELGSIIDSNTLVNSSNSLSTFGTQFFKNYDVVFNYPSKNILIKKRMEREPQEVRSLGFSFAYLDGKLMVNYVIVGSEAEKLGIEINDQIVQMNGVDYSDITIKKWCEMINNNSLKDIENLNAIIVRDGKSINYKIEKKVLLN